MTSAEMPLLSTGSMAICWLKILLHRCTQYWSNQILSTWCRWVFLFCVHCFIWDSNSLILITCMFHFLIWFQMLIMDTVDAFDSFRHIMFSGCVYVCFDFFLTCIYQLHLHRRTSNLCFENFWQLTLDWSSYRVHLNFKKDMVSSIYLVMFSPQLIISLLLSAKLIDLLHPKCVGPFV